MKLKKLLFILILLTGCTYSNLPAPVQKVVIPVTPRDTVNVAYTFSDLSKNNSFEESSIVCFLNDPRFFEASGIAASKINPGMLYLEEDSGNKNQFQLIDQACSIDHGDIHN